MKATPLLLLLLILNATACSSVLPEVEVHNRLRTLAGPRALDCGRAITPPGVASKSACAADAFRRKVPFLVQYRSTGTDAIAEDGLALDEHGKLSYVETIAWSPLYGGKPSGKFTVQTCNAGRPRSLSDGQLVCDLPTEIAPAKRRSSQLRFVNERIIAKHSSTADRG